MPGRQMVQILRRHVQKGSHLVDKGPGAAGAGAVHPFLHAAGQKEDLSVLAAQLDDHIHPVGEIGHRLSGGKDFLDKLQPRRLGQAEARRAGQRRGKFPVPDHRGGFL